ncbi:AraC family transcriptional regulator [Lacinutrix jangbogonensis]|uniref:AraC family transcriptional regulator n=1 Tax=Lacinutrix jangbogonensis TaxID=1469557 RepID=UPI0012E0677D|nr:AraC family transcriptional regulator [Lacinutrix jangbogonensis]
MNWLKKFTIVFILIAVFNLVTYSIDLIIHNGRESFLFIYPTLIINVGFIYWIGFVGFSKPKLLFNVFKLIENTTETFAGDLKHKLHNAMTIEEVYKNANLTLTELATQLEFHPKTLSKYINEVHHMNFSEFLNFHRIEKVKE